MLIWLLCIHQLHTIIYVFVNNSSLTHIKTTAVVIQICKEVYMKSLIEIFLKVS